MRRTALLVVTGLCTLVLAAPAEAQGPRSLMEDARGDAYAWDAEAFGSAAQQLCGAPCPAPGMDANGVGLAPRPALDLLDLVVDETPTDLVLRLGLAEVRADWAGAFDPNQYARFTLCLLEGCVAMVEVLVALTAGPVATESRLWVTRTPDGFTCSSPPNRECVWAVDLEVAPGTPGALGFRVPRVLLGRGGLGDRAGPFAATTELFTSPRYAGGMAGGTTAGVVVNGQPAGTGDTTRQLVDVASGGDAFVFATAHEPAPLPVGHVALDDARGDVAGEGGDALDILRMEFTETPESFTLSMQRAFVEAGDGGPYLILSMGWASRSICDFIVRRTAGVPLEVMCDPLREAGDPSLNASLTEHPGPMGWSNVTIPRATLEPTWAGEMVVVLAVHAVQRGATTAGPVAVWTQDGEVDQLIGGPPVVLAYTHPGTGGRVLPPFYGAPQPSAAPATPAQALPWVVLVGAVGMVGAAVALAGQRRRRSAAPPFALAPGEVVLGRYKVVRPLGEGAHGRAYLARDRRTKAPVVVKALRPTWGDEGAVHREALAMQALRHDRVVHLREVAERGPQVLLVMEYVPGGSLRDRLAAGPLDRAAFTAVARDLLEALGAVHAAGAVHRDVKPSNVLLDADGRAKLADFGLAHLPGIETTLGGNGSSALGTVRYMSPEQAKGHQTTARSDLFSAAVTLYEAWSGAPYLAAQPRESAVEVQIRAASPGRFAKPVADPGLRAWFARALDPRPERRFASAWEMRAALERALGRH